MTLESVLETLSWTIGLGLPFAAVWWGTRWIRKNWARVYARVVLSPALLLVFGPPLKGMATLSISIDRGEWKCMICGASEFQVKLLAWTLETQAAKNHSSPEFESWYRDRIHGVHEHDWMAVGCHYSKWGVSCSFDRGAGYFSVLPKLPSPEIADSMVGKLRAAEHAARLEMISRFDLSEPFRSISDGEPMPRSAFEQAYVTWLDRNTAWK